MKFNNKFIITLNITINEEALLREAVKLLKNIENKTIKSPKAAEIVSAFDIKTAQIIKRAAKGVRNTFINFTSFFNSINKNLLSKNYKLLR